MSRSTKPAKPSFHLPRYWSECEEPYTGNLQALLKARRDLKEKINDGDEELDCDDPVGFPLRLFFKHNLFFHGLDEDDKEMAATTPLCKHAGWAKAVVTRQGEAGFGKPGPHRAHTSS
jgi:hypothetical protein